MKQFIPLLLFLASHATVHAQEALPSALKAHADRYDQDRATLAAQAEASLKPLRARYLDSLAAADKAARAAVKTTEQAAIAAEIAAVGAESLTETFPGDLPRGLASPRREYLAGLDKVARVKPVKLREMAGTYLKLLATLEDQARRSKDAALAAAISTERQRASQHLGEAGGKEKRNSVVENGQFSDGPLLQWPQAWRGNVDFKKASDVQIMQEGDERFLRFRRLKNERQADLSPEKPIVIPANTREVVFSVRMRVENLVPGKEYETFPSLKITTRDGSDALLTDGRVEAREDTGWKRFSGRCPVPANAKALRVELGPFGAAGIIDFDDVAVEFR